MNFQPLPPILTPMSVLITGGAGYIGSHIAHLLCKNQIPVTIVDDLSTGHKSAIPSKAQFIEGDFANPQLLDEIFQNSSSIKTVIHCAAFIDVGESVQNPLDYFHNNFIKTQTLIKKMDDHKTPQLIFSSTASGYKDCKEPVFEGSLTQPQSPYGQSKLMCEWLIKSHALTSPEFRYVIFRYFNAAGAEPDQSNGQMNPNASHLIKRCTLAALGLIEDFTIFGTNYDTPDGTCIRDFIHIKDLATAHLSALQFLDKGNPSQTLNCGYMRGYSVKEIISTMQELVSSPFPVKTGSPRPGDLAQVVANNEQILKTLEWTPQFDDIREICKSTLLWEKKLQQLSKK